MEDRSIDHENDELLALGVDLMERVFHNSTVLYSRIEYLYLKTYKDVAGQKILFFVDFNRIVFIVIIQ